MAFRKGIGRGQFLLFPESLDEYVSEDSPVRLIDAFVERLDLGGLKFKGVSSKDLGRPSHDPRDLLKILIYGYFYGALSSRRMERESKVNVEEDGRSVVDITYEYEEAAVTEEMLAIKTPEDIRVCLHSGAIPKCMEGILSEARVEEVVKYHRDATESDVARMTPEDGRGRAGMMTATLAQRR